MKNDVSIGGKWNILGERYDGELVFNEQNGLILISIYYNGDFMAWNQKPLKFDEITGLINQKIKCILSDCEVIRRHNENFVRNHVVIRAKSIFFGTNIRKQNKLNFNRIDFRLTNIFPWTDMNGFKTDFNKPDCHFMITHKFKDKITIKIDENTSIEFIHTFGPVDGNMQVEEVSLSQYVNISIHKKTKSYYEDFFKELEKVKNLIMLATGQNVFIKEIYCYDDDKFNLIGGKKQFIKYQMIDYRIKDESEDISIRDIKYYLFTLSDLKIDDRLNLWIKDYDANEKIYELYLLSIKNDVPLEIRICNYMQAIELSHRQKYKNYNQLFKKHIIEKFKNNEILRNEILENPDQKNSTFITLRSRIIDIFTDDIELFKNAILQNNIVQFSEIMCNTRNYYTHYDESKKNLCLVRDNLICGINVLEYILCYIILERINFEKKFINVKLKERLNYILKEQRIENLIMNKR